MVKNINSTTCSQRVREKIPANIRRKVACVAHFSCSICRSIPIVFHHIEDWSTHGSNDEQYLIPLCDKCHRSIHGQGGSLYSKSELYEFKNTVNQPLILHDKLFIGTKKNYSFFIGSNFIANGEKANLIKLPGGHHLASIDTSDGVLKLSVLAEISGQNTIYLIKDNELMINTENIWDMHYSPTSLKIWKMVRDRKRVFIHLILKPDVIIIREMHTIFNEKLFRIFKLRRPQQSQLDKIYRKVRDYENIYQNESKKIDNLPPRYGIREGIDYDAIVKRSQKNQIKKRLEEDLNHEFSMNFNWDREYYQTVLSEILEKSSVFRKSPPSELMLPSQGKRIQEHVREMRNKYSEEFEAVKNVVAEYGGNWILEAMVV
jgi:hypothetical protein